MVKPSISELSKGNTYNSWTPENSQDRLYALPEVET